MASPISSPPTTTTTTTTTTFPSSFLSPDPTSTTATVKFKPLITSRKLHSLSVSCSSSSSDSQYPSSSYSDVGVFDKGGGPLKWLSQKIDEFVAGLKRGGERVEEEGIGGGEDRRKSEWDWDRWQKHFKLVDDQERVVSFLKTQLRHAIETEDYGDAARLKVAIAAAATNDTVGSVISSLKNAIEEERYQDAVFYRDNASAGLVGWWAGVSDDMSDPYGCIIRISAEHGRYVARGYSPRELATSTTGIPLFEVFVTSNEQGEYRRQAVYLKRKAASESSSVNRITSSRGKTDIFSPVVDDTQGDEDKDDPELADDLPDFQNILEDLIPGAKVKVLKVSGPGKMDRGPLPRVVEQISDEEDEEQKIKAALDNMDGGDKKDGVPSDSNGDKDDSEIDLTSEGINGEGQSDIAFKMAVGILVRQLSQTSSSRELVRVPAELKPKGRKSFSISVQGEEDKLDSFGKGRASHKRKTKRKGQRSVEHVMANFVKSVSRGEKIPAKALEDVADAIILTLVQSQDRQPLSGSTTFSRIDLPAYSEPLSGLYIGSFGQFTSEVIQLKRKFGQWQEDEGTSVHSNHYFYEYVEAVKLTGDPYVPAGQVAFRAKIGKMYQLPHKGIIPEEFGVVARYKGQGRIAEPGFENPRWVDGELVILDGKYIRGGPVIGFVYWDTDYQFLAFFNRLKIND